MASGGIAPSVGRDARLRAGWLALAVLLGALAWPGFGGGRAAGGLDAPAATVTRARTLEPVAVAPSPARPPVVSRSRLDRPGPVTTGATTLGLLVLAVWVLALAARTPDRGRPAARSGLRTRAPPALAG